MTLCKNLKSQVTVGPYQYVTTDEISSPTYAYKRPNPAKKDSYLEFPHFTVIDTGAGENEFRRFHYKFELSGETLSLKYFRDHGFDGPARPMTAAQEQVYHEKVERDLNTIYHPLALEFCNGVQGR